MRAGSSAPGASIFICIDGGNIYDDKENAVKESEQDRSEEDQSEQDWFPALFLSAPGTEKGRETER